MTKRIIYTVLAASMLISMLTACSTSQTPALSTPETSSSVPTASAQETGTPAATPMPDGPLDKMDPPVEIKIVIGDANPTIYKYAEGVTFEKNLWTDICRDKLGINIKVLWGVTPDQYDQKLNLTIASGELPDVMTVNVAQYEQLVEADAIIEINQLLDKYALPGIKKILANQDVVNITKRNGKLYALPVVVNPYESTQILFLRKDWLTNLNLTVPKTMDELLAVIEAFSSNDPDKNGTDDTYGLALTKDFNLKAFFSGYHAYPNIWVKDSSGALVYGSILPEVKTALGSLQKLYQTGAISKDFAVIDDNKVAEDLTSGKVGVYLADWWAPGWPLQQTMDKDPNAEWVALAPVSIDAQPALSQVAKCKISSYNVISKTCKHPEAIVKMINTQYNIIWNPDSNDIYNADFMDPQTYGWNAGWTGISIGSGDPDGLVLETKLMMEAFKSGDLKNVPGPDKSRVEGAWKYTKENKRDQWFWFYDFVADEGSWGVIHGLIDKDQYMYDEFYGQPTTTMVEKGEVLGKRQLEFFQKIVMGESIDNFDTFVSEWKSLGGNAMTSEVNDWYTNISK